MLRHEGQWKLSKDYEVWGKKGAIGNLRKSVFIPPLLTQLSLWRNFTIGLLWSKHVSLSSS